MQPLGLRNNNPLNIRKNPKSSPFKGEIEGVQSSFCRFSSIEWGLRAGFCTLRTYANRHNLHCVADIINRWAPANENNTQSYIQHVCKMTGFGGQQRLTEQDWPKLVKAMAKVECGVDLSDEIISLAYARSEK